MTTIRCGLEGEDRCESIAVSDKLFYIYITTVLRENQKALKIFQESPAGGSRHTADTVVKGHETLPSWSTRLRKLRKRSDCGGGGDGGRLPTAKEILLDEEVLLEQPGRAGGR